MNQIIDCLFIGHNETKTEVYEKTIRKMGVHSGAYRDLNLNLLWFNRQPFSASDTFNLFSAETLPPNGVNNGMKSLSLGNIFNPAIAYLATYLNRRGFSFDYVNAFQEEKEQLRSKLLQNNILTIAVITTLYVSVFPILEILDFIKTYNKTAKIIVGGPFIATQSRTQDPVSFEYLLENTIGADIYVNSSQGEAALAKIIEALKNNRSLDHIENICFKTDNGYNSTPTATENNTLSKNMVNWKLFPGDVGPMVNMRTSISCPFSCAFCGFPQHAGEFQWVEPDSIRAELLMLEKLETVKMINFIDDTFNVPVKRFKVILRMMITNKFKFKWVSNIRCQFIDREMVALMKESGCVGVFLGIESGNNQILKNMNKTADVESYARGINLLKEFDIVTFGSFITGFPGETAETLQDTIAFINETRLDFFRTQLWYCEPITPIWNQREKYRIEGSHFEWSHRSMDSKRAADLIEKVFFEVEESVWVPQYNFDYDSIWQLILGGMTVLQVKYFLNAFKNGIKERLKNPAVKNISFEVIKQLKATCMGINPFEKVDKVDEDNPEIIDQAEAEFDF